jgi:selT/selW/selH-like putative selenoprotein
VPSKGGAFEVFVDAKRVFSKLDSGRFPAYREVPGLIP